jgi:tetratricopeptide (TPR) repeat protein
MGQIALRRNDATSAVNYLLKATQLSGPTDVGPMLLLARAYRGARQHSQAAAVYMEVLQRRPNDAGLFEEAYSCSVEAEQFDTALKVVLLARERMPNEPRYAEWQNEVMARLKSGPAKKTQQRYEEADAKGVDVAKQLARARELLARNPPTPPHVAQEVAGILDQVLRLEPDHGEALALMGLCRFLLGDWDACEEYGKKAQAAGDKAKNKGWRDTGDFLLANLERKRAEKKAQAKSMRASGLKRAPTGIKRPAATKKKSR